MGFTDEELRARMMAEAEAAIDAVLAKRKPAEAITLGEIEELALTVREQIGAKVAQVLVEASAKRQPVPGPTCPQCGEEMHPKGKKRKRMMTAVGEVSVERDYFHCPTCKVGLFPLDARWRLNASGYSDTMSQQMVWLSGLLPYTQVVEVLARIGRQEVARTSVWERTQAHGERMRRHVAHQREQVAPERVVLPGPGQDHAQVKGVSLDGGMVNIRGEGWKEFKVGAVFDVVMRPDTDPLTGEATALPGATHIGYTAVLGDAAQFAPALWKLAVDKDVPRAARSSVTADGAAWIWNLVADYFPDSVQIVDWYHADEHLALAAQALYPDDEAQARRWRHQMHTPLYLGEAWRIAQNLHHAQLSDHAHYFHTHQRRMQYQDFREAGYPIGSGTVESGCKQFKARLTGPGMLWSRVGAARMLVIRAAIMERSFDRLWAQAA